MATFDLIEVQGYVADLNARMDRSRDEALRHHALICSEFVEKVRQWGREVFAGRVEFVAEVEAAWLEEGNRLHDRALEMVHTDQQDIFAAVFGELQQLLNGWVTPKLSVGPSARLGFPLGPVALAEARRIIDALPALPADWQKRDRQAESMGEISSSS